MTATVDQTRPDLGPLDAVKWVYRLFYSKTLGLAVILVMAAMVLAGSLIAQAPPGVLDNAESKAQFMDQAKVKYGGWAGVLDWMGGFHIFSSVPFVVVTVVLGLSILACTTHRLPQLWQLYRNPKVAVPRRLFDQARMRAALTVNLAPELAPAPEVALDQVAAHLKARRWRVIPASSDAAAGLYADKYAWAGIGTVLAHVSFILILCAFGISAAGGVDQTLTVPVGSGRVAVPGTDLELSANSFDANFNAQGRPLDYVSHLVVSRGGKPVAEQDVRVNEPLRVDGVKLHQATYGNAAAITVRDSAGRAIFAGPVALTYRSNDESRAIGLVELPGLGLELQVSAPASGEASAQASGLEPGQVEVGLFEPGDAEAVNQAVAEQGAATKLGDFMVTFEREQDYTGILLRRDPGAPLMWVGSVLLVLGMTVTLLLRHRRVYVLAQTEASSEANTDSTDAKTTKLYFASPDRAGVGLEGPFSGLVERMGHELNAEVG